MEYLPVGKRTRSQTARIFKEQNKRVRLAARNKWKEWKQKCLEGERFNNGGGNGENFEEQEEEEEEEDVECDAMVVDEDEFNVAVVNRRFEQSSAIVKKEMVEFDDDVNNCSFYEGNALFIDEKGYKSDDSVQILGEKWNPLSVGIACESEEEDDGVEVGPTYFEGDSSEQEDNVNSDADFGVKKVEGRSSSESSSDDDDGGGEVEDKEGLSELGLPVDAEFRRKIRKEGGAHGGSKSSSKKERKKERKRKRKRKEKERKERISGVKVGDGGIDESPVGARAPGKNSGKGEGSVNGVKKNSKGEGTEKEVKQGDVNDGVEEDTSTSSSDEDDDIHKVKKYKDDGETLRDDGEERQRKPRKKSKKKLKEKEVESVLLNTILEKGSTEGLEEVASPTQERENHDLLRKFKFGNEEVVREKTEDELEMEVLFKELDFGLGVCDIGVENSSWCEKEIEEAELCESAALQENQCKEGKHYLILDEEIGIKCKFCSYVVLEIKDVTPGFNENPFGRSSRNRRSDRLLDDEDFNPDKFRFPDSNCDSGAAHDGDTYGTVWDLIPGIKKTLYEHQQQGFEFIWRNVAGGIKIEELGKPSKYGIGGCIICHAPGTGKTRLAIVFLQSYLKQYPLSKPVIIAPSSMLLTWEEEFARWNVGIPFLNLNSNELSNKEIEVLGFVGDVKHKAVRKAKLCVWAMGKGILGISYPLFEKLAGERKGTEERIKKALLEYPGLLVLDEGHTPRNDESNIWKVFSEVHTKKRIILSGTPFQNNFDELNNTLSIIRDEFRDPFLRANHFKGGRNSKTNKTNCRVDEAQRIEELRNRMKPFVHVHKGEILRKALRGLFHSVLVLKPSELQKNYFRHLAGIGNSLLSDYLVCVACIHPSILLKCEQVPEGIDTTGLEMYRTDVDAGVKIKFLLELIKLSKGEKVLVFSQFLHPLSFIGEMLQRHFNWTEGNQYLLMVGKQRASIRQSFIGLFNDPKSEARVLLASTKACSEGIHLVGASRVVLLDVVWNPSVERQAISRAYRLGQKKDVYVYHLLTSSPQEGEKYYRQVAKDRVSEQVFTEEDGGQKTSTLSNVSEDRILEEMKQHEKMKDLFENIIDQPKVDKLIDSFAPLNL